MRSRYSAYALHLADYIIQTTHPDHPTYSSNHSYWKQEILQNTKNMLYEGLTIIEFIDGAQDAYVTFTAHLRHGKKNISFTEKSYFIKTNNIWFYKYGELKK
ncbi:MAG: hypothetical protein KGZ30_03245 [Anaplasmataceae bacterium]|nr:hypothetical protein [Anaplasmataceae bacterium]